MPAPILVPHPSKQRDRRRRAPASFGIEGSGLLLILTPHDRRRSRPELHRAHRADQAAGPTCRSTNALVHLPLLESEVGCAAFGDNRP